MKQLPKRSAFSRALPGPVAPAARIVEIDMVRGFALFGVLLVNMYNFGADSIARDSNGDQLAFALMRVFCQSKSWILFSMLFGFGPMEWMWRSLTYLEWQPLRLRNDPTPRAEG